MVNIVIFGIGKAYQIRKSFFEENIDKIRIVAFLDNDSKVQGDYIDEIPVYAPESIRKIEYDGVAVLSKKFGQEMIGQLLAMNVGEEKIWDLKRLKLEALRGKRIQYSKAKSINKLYKEKILIITTDMGLSGGIRVAVYAAKVLQDKGYEVMLSAPSIEEKMLEEVRREGLAVTIWDCLPYIFEEDREWICYYDTVIVNVFQMMNCAYEISKIRPVLWWIHEDRSIWKSFYQDTKKEFSTIDTAEWMHRLDVLGVSDIANEAFNFFYPKIAERILPFGIPDRYDKQAMKDKPKERVVFAVTAGFSIEKGQRVLVEAIGKLSEQERRLTEVWFIGPDGKNQKMLEEICDKRDNMRFLGLLAHEEIIELLPDVDVLVCPSLIETMSMSIVEGMMFEKLCITTDMTGVAQYLEDGKDGFVIKANDSDELAGRMAWIINNRDKWEPIKKEARKTYEREFSLERFGERLVKELEICKERFHENIVDVPSSIS